MEDQLINFDTAKLAKEKGFDWKSKCYHSDGSFQDRDFLVNYNHSMFKSDDEYLISAPTQSLLQKWLREIHKIEISIEPVWENESKKKTNYIPWVAYTKEEECLEDEEPVYFESYEDALEIGLQEALNTIK